MVFNKGLEPDLPLTRQLVCESHVCNPTLPDYDAARERVGHSGANQVRMLSDLASYLNHTTHIRQGEHKVWSSRTKGWVHRWKCADCGWTRED